MQHAGGVLNAKMVNGEHMNTYCK